jgi:ABC-type molybdate transport system substrate-binding protein
MKKMPAVRIALTFAALGLGGISVSAGAAEIKVLSTIALQTAVEDLGPKFGRANGHTVGSEFAITGALAKRLQDGEAADVFVGTRSAVDELIKAGKVLKGSDVDLANSGVSMAVRKGSAKPDISTSEALKHTLIATKALSYSDPASGGASGVHFAKVIERLGLTDQLKGKTKYPPAGGFTARLLVAGVPSCCLCRVSSCWVRCRRNCRASRCSPLPFRRLRINRKPARRLSATCEHRRPLRC